MSKAKQTPYPPIVINFGNIWPTSELLSVVLGTNVLCVSRAANYSTVVSNTANRGSDVGQMFQKINDDGGVVVLLCTLHRTSLL